MEIIFNDIAMHYQFKDKYDALEKMKIGIETLVYLRKQNTTFKICSQGKITGLEIAPGYYFPQLFSEDNKSLNQNHKTAIRTFFINFNNLTCGKDKFVFEGIESNQCGMAYRTNSLLFSLGTKNYFFERQITGDYVFEETIKRDVKIDNVSKKEHIDIHWFKLKRRIYESNPKHKTNYGWGSPMDLDEKEAQYVLDRAIMADKDEKHLIARYNGVYYSFRCHLRNFYHGYQDNSMPEDMKRRLTNISLNYIK